ncbi:MAG: hypothetical protein JF593_08905 [Novosphingobium sp.]|nr:hypothetical protein [Novosphingobium sp.]
MQSGQTPFEPLGRPQGYRASGRTRAPAVAASLAVTALMILVLVTMTGNLPILVPDGPRLVAFDLSPPVAPAEKHLRATAHKPVTERPTLAAPARATMPKPTPVVKVPTLPFPMINLSKEELAASDIGKMPRHGPGSGDAGEGKDSKTAYGPGEGPGGARLYNAEWYREPTDAELVTYMPAGAHQGDWAMVACRTIENFHVDNCQELQDSRPGSGLARGLRQASWQFLVRPPRIEGRPLIGAWVRIRFDLK